MNAKPEMGRRSLVALMVVGAALILPALASAHARVSPAVSVAGTLQLYSLAVPTEKSRLTTTKIVMTVPAGFTIDAFVPPPPGWTQRVGVCCPGGRPAMATVTWTGGKAPTGEAALFEFLAQPASSKTYTFDVRQTYSDGSIVNWAGPESSAAPAPTIEVKDSLGGGGVSALTLIALIVGVLGLIVGGFALMTRTGRELA